MFLGGEGPRLGTQRIDVFDQAVVAGSDRGVADRNLLIAVGGHGEDAELEQAAVHVLEQARIEGAPDNVGVDLAGLVGLDEFAGNFLAVDPHGEPFDVGPLRHREDVLRFELTARLIVKRLFNVRDGHLFIDGDVHLVRGHGQGSQVPFDGDQMPLGLGGLGD